MVLKMVLKESKWDDTTSFLGGHGTTQILTDFPEKMSARPKAVSATTRRALVLTLTKVSEIQGAEPQKSQAPHLCSRLVTSFWAVAP